MPAAASTEAGETPRGTLALLWPVAREALSPARANGRLRRDQYQLPVVLRLPYDTEA